MQRILLILLTFVFLFVLSAGISAAPNIEGQAYVLIDGKSGQILLGKGENIKLHPASTTKILTTIIALENAKMDEIVTISKNVSQVEGTKVYLREGEKITLEKLLHAAMVHSANDAALAIAEHISGTQEEFALEMNKKAKAIGAKNSNFVNPHGLTNQEHLTTAYDLALIGRYAMENPAFRVLAQEKVYDWQGEEWQTRLINKNKFLWRMDEATGIKPGFTSEAKYTLVASAEKNNQQLIAVILGSSDGRIWDDAKSLLSYGFDNFQYLSLSQHDEIVATLKFAEKEVNLVPTRSASIAVANNEEASIERKVVLSEAVLPISPGDIVGELVISVNGSEQERIPLKTLEGVEEPLDSKKLITNILAGLFLLQIFIRLSRRYLKRKRRSSIFSSSRRSIDSYRF
ncbi:MAG: D-alanyl-D-alanine carboxypeptidase family protein [Bacillota bacterium]